MFRSVIAVIVFNIYLALCNQHAQACDTDQYECDNGRCTQRNYVCDTDNDCGDWSDEHSCTCESHQFKCANGRCKPGSYRCDGDNDCGDESDEQNCERRRSCTHEIRQCNIALGQHYLQGRQAGSQQEFVETLKAIPLDTHCSYVGDFMKCMTDLEEDCSSELAWGKKEFPAQKLAYYFVCDQHFEEFNNSIDCLHNMQTFQDFEACATADPPRGNCTEEAFAKAVDQMTSCMKQSFTVRINNGADRCTQTASDLVIDLINQVAGLIHPCPGIHGKRRVARQLELHGAWKKQILSYFNLKH